MTRNEAINWLINATADIGKIEHRDLWHYEQALSEIKEMLEESADVVEVVRCKDCIHSYVFEPWEGTNAIRYCKTLKNHYGDSDMWVEDNDYCSYGEEK